MDAIRFNTIRARIQMRILSAITLAAGLWPTMTTQTVHECVAGVLAVGTTIVCSILMRVFVVNELCWLSALALLPGTMIWLVAITNTRVKTEYIEVGIHLQSPLHYHMRMMLTSDDG